MKKKTNILIILFASLVLFDQITKTIFTKQTIDLGILLLRPVTNTGMSFGLFQGNNLAFIIISIIFITLLILFRKEFKGNETYLVMILAGAVGNLIDRILHGHVLDFIDFRFFPVFNVADSIIFLGVAGIMINEVREMIREKNKTKQTEAKIKTQKTNNNSKTKKKRKIKK